MQLTAFKKKVGKNIKSARKRRNLTQEDMESHGFNVRHYQDLEGGKVDIRLSTLVRLAKTLKVSIVDLIK